MSSYLLSNLSLLSLSHTPKTIATKTTFNPIRCGPRNNRGPLLKGRTLTSEAIQAVQSLKRVHRSNNPSLINKTLSRLIKSDLIATLNELIRQNNTELALKVFAAVRYEHTINLTAYADIVSALARKHMWDDIDRLIVEMENEGVVKCDDRGLVKLVKALIAAGRGESTVRIYGMMKRSGWGSDRTAEDEYLGRVLGRGFRRFGEERLAKEVDVEVGNLFKDVLEKGRV